MILPRFFYEIKHLRCTRMSQVGCRKKHGALIWRETKFVFAATYNARRVNHTLL